MRTGAILLLSLAALCAQAEDKGPDTVQVLRSELERLKVEQAARAVEMQKLEDRLAALEASTGRAEATPASPPVRAASAQVAGRTSRLEVTGDFRLRYEGNSGDADASDWDRGVLRARLGATYAVNDWLTVGGRLATGDPDDPNSSDVTTSTSASTRHTRNSSSPAPRSGAASSRCRSRGRSSCGTAMSIHRVSARITESRSAAAR
jgi:hypothetical protein